MNPFEQFAYDEVAAALAGIDPAAARDIYALSFYVDHNGDPRLPVLRVGYNTGARAAKCTPSEGRPPRWPVASSAGEATWNFAFWLQNEMTAIGEPGTEGASLLVEDAVAAGLWFTEEEYEADFDRYSLQADEIKTRFVTACVRVAGALHAAGVVTTRFSHAIPIIVHELEYHDRIAVQTRAANPPGLAQEFEDWIASLHAPGPA